MMLLNLVLLLVALIFFGLAALGIATPKIASSIGAGLFFLVLSMLVPMLLAVR